MYADHYVLARARREASNRAVAEQCYASAYRALESGDDVNAKRLFGLLAIMTPREDRPWIGLAICSERKADWAMAGAMYAMGASLASESAWAEFGRARALKRMGKSAQAQCAFDRAEAMTTVPNLLTAIEEERRSP